MSALAAAVASAETPTLRYWPEFASFGFAAPTFGRQRFKIVVGGPVECFGRLTNQ